MELLNGGHLESQGDKYWMTIDIGSIPVVLLFIEASQDDQQWRNRAVYSLTI
jgi:hypothetical protein